jgi:hypothetical protein
MLKKIMIWICSAIIILLISVYGIYYINIETEPEQMICYKGKLLLQLQDGESIYTRAKGVTCEYENGILIIEEQS